jgi:S1-C subfamily serine protease
MNVFVRPCFFRRLIVASMLAAIHVADGQDDLSAVPPSIEAIMAKVRPSLVTVMQDGRDGAERGIGSGFVVSADGLIATNLHVTGEGRPVRVRLVDGREPKVVAIHAWDMRRICSRSRLLPKAQPGRESRRWHWGIPKVLSSV